MRSVPSIVYKYMTFNVGEKVLTCKKMRATPPNDFNDPFEMLPRSYTGISDDILFKEADKRMKSQKYYQLYRTQNPTSSYGDYLAYLGKDPSLVKEVAKKLKNTMLNRDFTELVDEASKTFGVLCFSGNNDNILMWSHYANEHKGVVIGFDSALLWQKWFSVNYQAERIDIPFDESHLSSNYVKAITDVLTTKSLLWEYENEFRFIVKLSLCQKEQIGGKDMWFFTLPEGCITTVICGARMVKEERKKIGELFTGTVIDAKMDQREFKVIIP